MNKNIKKIIFVNILTGLRIFGAIALIPIFYIMGSTITSLLFLFIISTDWIDGFLARKLRVSTFFGALLDGLSDKLFGIISLFLLCNTIPSLWIALFLELAILSVGIFKLLIGKSVKSSLVGKAKMWVLAAGIFIGLITSDYTSFIKFYSSLNLPIISINSINIIRNSISLLIIISEVLTLVSYLISNNKEAKKTNLLQLKERLINLKNNIESQNEILKKLFDTTFYDKNKGKGSLKLFLKNTQNYDDRRIKNINI